MPEIKKILVIRFSSFGDIVLSYPFISLLKKTFPGCTIDFITKENFSGLVKMHKDIGKVLILKNESLSELKELIEKNNYDLILDIHKNIRSVLSTTFLKPRIIRYKKGTFKKLLLVLLKLNLLKNSIPVYKRYLLAINKIHKIDNFDFATTDLNFNKEPILKEPYILIAPSSKHFSKTLPKEIFGKIINEIKNKKIVLIGDNTEKDSSICNYLSGLSKNIINYCGKTDFGTLANLVHNSEIVICNDSGILHLAESLGKKVIVFFGSTVKEFGFYPQLKSTVIFENNNLKCRPCTHIGKNKCPKKHFNCMNKFDTNEILKIIYENNS